MDDRDKTPINDEKATNEKTTADYIKACPACGEQMPIDAKLCPKCGYVEGKKGGYQPMTAEQIRRTRSVLFVVLMVVAVIVYILVVRK